MGMKMSTILEKYKSLFSVMKSFATSGMGAGGTVPTPYDRAIFCVTSLNNVLANLHNQKRELNFGHVFGEHKSSNRLEDCSTMNDIIEIKSENVFIAAPT